MAESSKATGWPRRYGRYLVFEEFARGGMASVHLGRLVADRGFSRLVAVKMLSQDRALSSFYARALEDEARIASRVRHPNVVQPLDVVAERGDVLYVMEYVHGVALAQLLDTARANAGDPRIPRDVTIAVMLDVLSALHAAHEAKDETGRPLGVVHRDVSPHNVLVGVDGLARLADFGVAKAMRREERTATGAVKGKPSYMAPEQQRGLPVTRQADVYAAGVVLAVALTGAAPAPAGEDLAAEWLRGMIERIDDRELLDVVVTATQAQARARYATAAEMAATLAAASARGTAEAVGACVQVLAGEVLEIRGELARRVESADAEEEVDTNPAHAELDREPDTNPQYKAAPPPAATIGMATVPLTRSSRPPLALTLPLPPVAAPVPARTLPLPLPRDVAPAPAAPARSATPIFLFIFGVSIVVGIFFFRAGAEPAPARGPATVPTGITPAPSPVASASTPAAEPSLAASVVRAPPIRSAAGSPTPRPRPLAGSTRSRAPASPDDRTAPPPPPPAADCDPPFRIDAQGRKHYKPECVP